MTRPPPALLLVAALAVTRQAAADDPPDTDGPPPPTGDTGGALTPAEPAAGAATHAVPAPPPAAADDDEGDAFSWRVAGQSYARLFQRALTPGAAGGSLEKATAAPFYQYVLLRIDDLDVPWQEDSLDVELAAWGDVEMGEIQTERRVDGDLTLALVRHRVGPARFVLGRQVVAGGAARFSRFDGLAAGVTGDFGLGLDAYGGFTVLPRWNGRPGYQLLGSVAETLVKSPEALETPARARHWLAGARAHYAYQRYLQIGASVHEEHAGTTVDGFSPGAGGIARRDFGIDLRSDPMEELGVHGQLLLDVDAVAVSEARLGVDVWPHETLLLMAGYGHAVPSLLISQQSVLSVFSTDAYDEGGLEASFRPVPFLAFTADGWIERFSDASLGARTGLAAHYRGEVATATLGYRRIVEGKGGDGFSGGSGYHGLRAAVGVTPLEDLRVTAEAHSYFYDHAVTSSTATALAAADAPQDGRALSWIGALTGRYAFLAPVALTVGGSIAQTPYAKLDAQLLVRLELDFRGGER
ncbi:MAG: hypothetical protein HY908_37135 [Myxococcales bacterium]|nr:hypothetical protein [Myxococcales bacterium]